jgi:hypothetical protein
MNTATIIKIDVHHIIDGVHTDECEKISGDEWNEDIPRSYVYDMEGSKIFNYGIYQCPH